MDRAAFQKIKLCQQQDKYLVSGYIKQIQSILPHEENSYFIIDLLVQSLILLYFYKTLDSKILTDDEQSQLMQMLEQQTNNKFKELMMEKWFNLVYKAFKEDIPETEFKNEVFDKKNILILIHTQNNNVVGGYTSFGLNSFAKEGQGIKDDDVFILSIRSSKGHKPGISYINEGIRNRGLSHPSDLLCIFENPTGETIFALNKDRYFYAYLETVCVSFTKQDYLFGETRCITRIDDIEIFQMI